MQDKTLRLPEEIRSRLKARRFGRKIHCASVTESTNDDAIRRAKEGGEEGEVFIAERQTAGRGRLGRAWESPPGKNLYLSILLRPPLRPVEALPMTLVVAASLHEAILPFLPAARRSDLKIKWPNDLYLGDKKLAGILTEMESDPNRVHWVVCGIGVDLNAEAEDFSPEVRKIATSVRLATGGAVDRASVAAEVIDAMEREYERFLKEGSRPAIRFCEEYSYLKGKKVRAEGPEGKITGAVAGLDPQGFLLVRGEAGQTVTIRSGDVDVIGD